MNRQLARFARIFCCVMIFGGVMASAQTGKMDQRARYLQARKQCMKQDWHSAISVYREILQDDPSGDYADDAQFWLAFSLEKLPEEREAAFDAYQHLREQYPNSNWADDGLLNQVMLAEALARSGNAKYHRFLVEQLGSRYDDVRHQAALALGRLGDPAALPVLRELVAQDAFVEIADKLVKKLEDSTPKNSQLKTLSSDSRATQNFQKISIESEEALSAISQNSGISFETRRYEQYRTMLKTDDSWNFDELIDFGMWHILAPEQFQKYFSLTTRSDREKWLDNYWKSIDPSPATAKNEARDAFEARVRFARSHFYEYWDNLETKYLQDQYIRSGSPHAPWDARGELYIKFGEPDYRSNIAWHTENWKYTRHNLDLMVKQYVTNIYGNAITATTISNRQMQRRFDRQLDKERMEARYIYTPMFDFANDDAWNELNGVKFDESLNGNLVRIEYSLPEKEVRTDAKGNFSYSRTYVLFDDDMQEIRRESASFDQQSTGLSNNRVGEVLTMQLQPGKYKLLMRIEVPHLQKLGKYQFDITVGF